MTKEQVPFKPVKASEMPLNGKQLDLLALIGDARGQEHGTLDGSLVYGRGPTETVEALRSRGLVEPCGMVLVIIMGKLEKRALWCLTAKGQACLNNG